MSAITDFKDKLLAAPVLEFNDGTDLAYGTNLFVGQSPGTPDDAVILTGFPTPGPERKMGALTAGIVYHNVMVQVVVRSKNYTRCQAMCASVVERIDNFTGAIGANTYHHILMRSGWMEFGHDESKRFRMSATFMMRGPVL